MNAVILLYVPGATSEQIEYGIELALAVLEKQGVTPEGARQAFDHRRWWNSDPKPVSLPGDDAVKAWMTYDAARWAAIEACRDGANDDIALVFEIVLDPLPH